MSLILYSLYLTPWAFDFIFEIYGWAFIRDFMLLKNNSESQPEPMDDGHKNCLQQKQIKPPFHIKTNKLPCKLALAVFIISTKPAILFWQISSFVNLPFKSLV